MSDKSSLLSVLVQKHGRLLLIAIFCVACLWRVIYFIEISYSPYGRDLTMDSSYHHEWAVRLAEGEWMPKEVFFRAPLYPYLLGIVYRFANNSQDVAKLLQLLLGCGSCLLLYRVGRQYVDNTTSLLATFMAAIYGMSMYFENELLIVPLIMFLDLLVLLSLRKAAIARRAGPWLTTGLLCGLSAIARPNILLFVVFVPVWYWFVREKSPNGKSIRIWIGHMALLTCGCLIPVLPVTVTNYVVGGDRVLIASQGGVNFYIGNNPRSNGVNAVVPDTRPTWQGGYEDQVRMAKEALGNPNAKPSEISGYWYDKGWEYIRENPGAATKHMLFKLYLFWNAYEIGNNRVIRYVTRHSVLFRFFTIRFWCLCPLAFVGIFLALRRRRPVSLLLLFIASYTASFILFFVNGRFRMPLIPFLILFAAYAIVEWRRQIATGSGNWTARLWHGDMLISLVIVVLTAVLIRPYPGLYTDATQGHYNEGQLWIKKQDFNAAIPCFEQVVRLKPNFAQAHHKLGESYARGPRDYERAVLHLEKAHMLEPKDTTILNNLGVAYFIWKKYDKAEQYFRKLLTLDAKHFKGRKALASVYELQGRWSDSLQQYERLATDYPDSAGTNAKIAEIRAKLGRGRQVE